MCCPSTPHNHRASSIAATSRGRNQSKRGPTINVSKILWHSLKGGASVAQGGLTRLTCGMSCSIHANRPGGSRCIFTSSAILYVLFIYTPTIVCTIILGSIFPQYNGCAVVLCMQSNYAQKCEQTGIINHTSSILPHSRVTTSK